MALIKDDAIVLRRLDFSETSQVLAIFTRAHGQQRLIAKGIKRSTKQRASVGIDLLELGAVVIFQRAGHEDRMGTITEWQQRSTFPHLRASLKQWYAAQYAAEAVAQLTEVHDPHPAVFDSLASFLEQVSHRDSLSALVEFLWILLTQLGMRPELSRCMSCGNELDLAQGSGPHITAPLLYFSSREGGAICRDCEPNLVEKLRIDSAAVRGLQANRIESTRDAAHAFALLDYHLRETIGRPLRLSAPIKSTLATIPG
jgi:DNA repair protein RecO (recombination protein O)